MFTGAALDGVLQTSTMTRSLRILIFAHPIILPFNREIAWVSRRLVDRRQSVQCVQQADPQTSNRRRRDTGIHLQPWHRDRVLPLTDSDQTQPFDDNLDKPCYDLVHDAAQLPADRRDRVRDE